MAKPSAKQISDSLGIELGQVTYLVNRGMPTNKISKSLQWFKEHGFNFVEKSKSGGAVAGKQSISIHRASFVPRYVNVDKRKN